MSSSLFPVLNDVVLMSVLSNDTILSLFLGLGLV